MSGTVGKRLYRTVMEAQRSKLVLLSGTPVINHPYELCRLLNLARGPMSIYRVKTQEGANLPSIQEISVLLQKANLWKYIDTITYGLNKNIEFSLLPFGYVRTGSDEGAMTMKDRWNTTDVPSMVQQIVGFFANAYGTERTPIVEEGTALPDTKEEFQEFFMSNPQDPRIQNENLFMRRILGLVSYYRTAGEEYFPRIVDRKERKERRVEMSDHQFSNYIEQRKKERQNDEKQRQVRAMQPELFDKQSSVYRAFSRMSCNFVFPDGFKRPYPGDLRRELKREIDSNPLDEPEEVVEQVATADVVGKYDRDVEQVMKKLYEEREEYLRGENLQKHSPKFAKMLEDIEKSEGSVLFYSQFRSVEGIRIFEYVLEANGYAQIKVVKENDQWVIANAQKVLSKEYEGKRFVVFEADREKTELLLRIFNGQQVGYLPNSIQEQLKAAGYGDSKNLYGDLARVMMISQSGAEGISLKNVRRVLIAEPFWNMVRIEQVIGRAVRAKSHNDLPPEDRTVQVFIYQSVFTKQQMASKEQQVDLDDKLTTDEHIYKIAQRKDRIIRQFLTMMKMAAIDCMSHAPRNKPLSTKVNVHGKQMGMKCYAFAINAPSDELAYQPSWSSEINRLNENPLERNRQIQGKVQRLGPQRKKYVVVPGMQGVFDYNAYVSAGVLVPTQVPI
jgi:Helicase conserved C-terminal domain